MADIAAAAPDSTPTAPQARHVIYCGSKLLHLQRVMLRSNANSDAVCSLPPEVGPLVPALTIDASPRSDTS